MFYVIEHDKKPDGTINVSEVGRTTEVMARSYYYERYSKMLVTEQFKSVALMLVDEDLTVYDRHLITTQYKEPVAEELLDEDVASEPSMG